LSSRSEHQAAVPAQEIVRAQTPGAHFVASSYCSRPGTLMVGLDGELDIAAAPTLDQLLREVERDRWPTVVLDLRALTFIDSIGLRVILTAHQRIGCRGGRLLISRPSRTVRRTLAAIGADSILDFADLAVSSGP
jgi:anti-anti-sigma factor